MLKFVYNKYGLQRTDIPALVIRYRQVWQYKVLYFMCAMCWVRVRMPVRWRLLSAHESRSQTYVAPSRFQHFQLMRWDAECEPSLTILWVSFRTRLLLKIRLKEDLKVFEANFTIHSSFNRAEWYSHIPDSGGKIFECPTICDMWMSCYLWY